MIIPQSNYEKRSVGTEENCSGKLQRARLKKRSAKRETQFYSVVSGPNCIVILRNEHGDN